MINCNRRKKAQTLTRTAITEGLGTTKGSFKRSGVTKFSKIR